MLNLSSPKTVKKLYGLVHASVYLAQLFEDSLFFLAVIGGALMAYAGTYVTKIACSSTHATWLSSASPYVMT